MLGIRTWGRMNIGADESTELFVAAPIHFKNEKLMLYMNVVLAFIPEAVGLNPAAANLTK